MQIEIERGEHTTELRWTCERRGGKRGLMWQLTVFVNKHTQIPTARQMHDVDDAVPSRLCTSRDSLTGVHCSHLEPRENAVAFILHA